MASSGRTDKAPRVHKEIREFKKKGLILVYTGGGKGKTTAAFGSALRALGRGWKVAMVQFIKGKWRTGESEAAKRFGDQFQIFPFGEGFTWETKNFEQDVKTARRAWEKCRELLRDTEYPLVIFDEINYVMGYNFLDPAEVLAELRQRPPFKHVILTGNRAPKKIIEAADLVTEMKCVKHPYREGIKAQPGIEY